MSAQFSHLVGSGRILTEKNLHWRTDFLKKQLV